MTSSGTLLIRADANSQIGSGHVMRCLALAQAWQDAGGRAIFLTAPGAPLLEERLRAENCDVHHQTQPAGSVADAWATANLARTLNAAWIVIDGYELRTPHFNELKQPGWRVLRIDDFGLPSGSRADTVLNQNLYAERGLYAALPQTQLLIGTSYALLRREFQARPQPLRNEAQRTGKILVTMGGGDPDNVTLRILEALQLAAAPDMEVVVIAGASNVHLPSLCEAVVRLPFPARVESNVTAMPDLMAWADIAISAAGSTVWELAYMGVPSLVAVLADNQRSVAGALAQHNIAINLGEADALEPRALARQLRELLDSPRQRDIMARRGQALVDGRGAERVARYLNGTGFELRRAAPQDCKLLWNWANEDGVRRASFDSRNIPWEQHRSWFSRVLASPNSVILIATDALGMPVGQVRFDIQGEQAEIDIGVAKERRGQGMGVFLIEDAVRELFASTGVGSVKALVKTDNVPSLCAFEKAGFSTRGHVQCKGCTAVHLERIRPDVS